MSIWKGFWFGGSVTVPGIRLVGGYVLNTGTTMDLNYELRYYVIDDSGDRHPSTGYEVQPFTYSYGQNDVNITSGAQSKDVTINIAETFNVISTSGFSFIVNPELSATLSGGAWSEDAPNQLINTDYTLVNLEDNIDFQGNNTVIYTLTDPNADTFSADNTIVLRYTPDIYIVAVDNNTNVTDPVETSEYQVDLTYVLGGVFTTSAGLEWTGGTSATEPAVSLQPGDNTLVVGPYPDDFGNEESSYEQLVTKVPSLNYVGLTSVDAETYGTNYTATSGLEIDVDVGAPYATAIDESFIFTSGDYRTYDFDLSYGYPSQPSASATTSVSIDYTMTSASTALPIKLWDYTTDEFIITEDNGTLIADNTNPTGDMVLNLRETPTFVDNDQDYYHTTYGLDAFTGGVSPKIGNTVDCTTNALYASPGTISDKLFKPEEDWFYSDWYTGPSNIFLGGRGNQTNAITTAIYASGGNFRTLVGGVDTVVAVHDIAKAYFIEWKNYFNGSDWVDDLWINGEVIHQNRSADRGTGVSTVPVLFRARWATTSEVFDPATQAIDFNGGYFHVLRVGDSTIEDREITSLFFKNKNHLSICINGDSNGVPFSDGDKWPDLLQDESISKNYHVQYLNSAIAARNFYSGSPETAENGFDINPPWTTGRPNGGISDQSVNFVIDNFFPELVLTHYTSNIAVSDYFDKNPNAGTLGTSGIGNNAYSDEKQYMMLASDSMYESEDIISYWADTSPKNDTTLVTADLIPAQDALASMSSTLTNDTSITNLIPIFEYLVNSPIDNTIKPEYNLDGTHYNSAGNQVVKTQYALVLDPILTVTSENNFTPIVVITSPLDGGIVTETPVNVEWTHDDSPVSDTEVVSLGANTITREYTNTGGFTGSDSVDVTYVVDPRTDADIQSSLSVITDPGGTPKFLDESGNGNDILLLGTPTIDGGRWKMTSSNGDCGYIPGTESDDSLTDPWAYSIVVERFTDNFASQTLMGKSISGFSSLTQLAQFQTDIYTYVGGNNATKVLEDFRIVDGQAMLSYQNRYTGSEWVIDFYYNGIFVTSTNVRGSTTNSAPIMIGALPDGGDPLTGITNAYDGYAKNFVKWNRTLTAMEWSALNQLSNT